MVLKALGELWRAGVKVDWPALHKGERRRRVPLPTSHSNANAIGWKENSEIVKALLATD